MHRRGQSGVAGLGDRKGDLAVRTLGDGYIVDGKRRRPVIVQDVCPNRCVSKLQVFEVPTFRVADENFIRLKPLKNHVVYCDDFELRGYLIGRNSNLDSIGNNVISGSAEISVRNINCQICLRCVIHGYNISGRRSLADSLRS